MPLGDVTNYYYGIFMTKLRRRVYSALSLITILIFLPGLLWHFAAALDNSKTDDSGTYQVKLEEIKKDGDGDGIVDLIGDTVTVSGISNIASGLLHEQYLQLFIQNKDAGLSLFSESIDQPVGPGDSVVATGVVQDYYSLIEVNVIDYQVYPASSTEPRPQPLADVMGDLNRYEGMLVGGKGTVAGKGNRYNGKYLMISPSNNTAGQQPIMAYVTNFHSNYQDFDFESISVGDEVEITGVLTKYSPAPAVETDPTYKIHLRTPADLSIVGISINQMIIWGALGLALVLVVTGWIVSLRSTVKSKTRELKKSLHDKEILLKEIHHRVKNNLAIMSGLFELQLDSTESTETEKVLRNSQSRLQSMALVHDKLYQTSSLNEIEMSQYIPELVESLRDTFKSSAQNVELHFDIEDIRLDIDHAIPCGLLINEIVVNAFKHAFDKNDEPHISVSMYRRQHKITLDVSDNGRGISENFDIQSSHSLGMMLIETFREQLEGTLEIESENGTRFTLVFSID